MALPQGIKLQQNLGDSKVYATGPGGRYWVRNPQEAAKLFGNDWAQNIEKVRPGSFDDLKEYQDFGQAMRAPGATDPQAGGNLNFGGTPNPSASDHGFGQSYANALSMNQQLYGQILQGYQGALGAQGERQQQIQQGYGQLGQDVQNTLQGAEAGQRQRIADQYAQAAGSTQQGLSGRGLSNTTVADSLQRGLLTDRSKAEQDLSGQFAQMRAGYQSNLGQAGLGYGASALKDSTSLLGQQLGWMDSYKQPYPDPLGYGQLGQQGSQFGAQLGQQQNEFQQNLSFQQSQDPLARMQRQQQQQRAQYPSMGPGY